ASQFPKRSAPSELPAKHDRITAAARNVNALLRPLVNTRAVLGSAADKGTLDRGTGCCDKSRNPAANRGVQSMKAILCTRFGGPDDLELAEVPDPVPGAGEVVVAVKAAALNFFDTLIIAGKYQLKPPFPFSPAAE